MTIAHRFVHTIKAVILTGLALWMMVPASFAAEEIDHEMTVKIREEGFSRSQVMELAWVMTDLYVAMYPLYGLS